MAQAVADTFVAIVAGACDGVIAGRGSRIVALATHATLRRYIARRLK